MSDPIIEKALERLEGPCEFAWVNHFAEYGGQGWPLDNKLAALISAAAETMNGDHYQCRICNCGPDEGGSKEPTHAPDCPLLALCRAIVGEGKP